MPSILDKAFKYTQSGKTDIRKTFARIRREQAAALEAASRPTQLLTYRRKTK